MASNVTITNQLDAGMQDGLRSHSVYANCNKCKHQAYTNATRSCSVYAVLCCFLGCMALCQMCKGKDITPCNAEHKCANCNHVIGNYSAM